ncbi:hypothetical protein [Spirulina subsalsa]|uniref:hypothetical protein n=1 Tax=Spirulina subsalsa TaxID=54311 RepID=UPI0003099586|nr:hypothetical protein [Spirulina subsalsa]
MKTLVQIVPTLPPGVDGLGDYALYLAQQLKQDWHINTRFVVGDANWQGTPNIEDFSVRAVSERSAKSLGVLLEDTEQILLQYSGYGYAQRGCPNWLAKGLKTWRQQGGYLVTFFHELYAYDHGPPWSSSFWYSPLQKRVARRLVQLSDRTLTSKQAYAQRLQALHPAQSSPISSLPVFSTIGEPPHLTPLNQRTRRMIVFGHRNSRTLAYERDFAQLERVCQALEITEIEDIGVPLDFPLPCVNGVTVRPWGVLDAGKISALMQDAIAGFLSTPPPAYLAKSTIFAAYCAHGLIPVLTLPQQQPEDHLTAMQDYWHAHPEQVSLSFTQGEAIAHQAHCWYQDHSLPKQAKIIATLFSP